MKRILTFISVAALLVACNDIYGPTEAPTPVVESDGIDITVKEVKDSSVTFVLTPKSESAYYSWLVDQSAAAEQLDSSKLYSVSYKGVAQGIVKWADDNSKTITVKNLTPNTPYVIYAVAGSTTGVPSAVVNTAFKTSDKVAPSLVKYSSKDGVVSLTYDEDIVEGSCEVNIKYYAINTDNIDEGTPEGEVKAEVEVKGAVATVSFEIPEGAYWSADVAEGAFKDAAGNLCAAVGSSLHYDAESGEVVGEGIYGRRNLGGFTIGEAEQELLTNASSPITAELGAEYGYGRVNKKAEVVLSFGNDSKVTSFLLVANKDYGYSEDRLMFFLPEEPARGNQVAIEVPAGTFEDIYGNPNAAWEAEALYAYDYTEETILGSYSDYYRSAFDGEAYEGGTVIVKSDDETKGNVMFTTFCGEDCKLYATWEPQMGTVSINPFQYFYSREVGGTLYYAYLLWCDNTGNPNTKTSIVLSVPEKGTIQNTEWFGFYAFNAATYKGAGWFDIAYQYQAVKNDADSGTTAASAVRARGNALHTGVILDLK